MQKFPFLLLIFFSACSDRPKQEVPTLTTPSSEYTEPDTQSFELTKPLIPKLYQFKGLLKDFQIYLVNLDESDVTTIKTATEKFKIMFKSAKKETCDSAYYLFETYYDQVDESINEQHYKKGEIYDSLILSFPESTSIRLSKNLTQYQNTLKTNGFQIAVSEGITYIRKDRDYVSLHFYSFLSPLMAKYLEQCNKENKEGYGEDGGLIIEPTTLVDRLIWWENFNRENPIFLFAVTSNDLEEIYTRALILGEDNTPIFYEEPGPLNEYYKTAYDYLFSKYTISKTATMLKPYYVSLLKFDTAGIREFRESVLQLQY